MMMGLVVIFIVVMVDFPRKADGFKFFTNWRHQVNQKMVSIDWQQNLDSEDGMKYHHDEVTCTSFLPLSPYFLVSCCCFVKLV